MSNYILSIDQGTTSTRAILFDNTGTPCAKSQQEFEQLFPSDGWVEHRPQDIWQATLSVCQNVIESASTDISNIACIGITNQRETTIVWDKKTGQAIANAIVWQDRRTADYCEDLKFKGHESTITKKTGLLLDPYFSASKLNWLLENTPGARDKADAGELLFGTIDCYLLWNLTKGKSHKTDATNASRTMLFNIHTQAWDDDLLELFNIPKNMLPEVLDCSADFGVTDASWFGKSIPITGIAGDQQAALVGQTCFQPGMVKSTYGTGCFMIMNTGSKPVSSNNRLLTTVGYRLNGKVTYAVEGSIFVAGAAIQWLRDGLQLIEKAEQTEDLAKQADPNSHVYMVPAFTGLGAPYWDPYARGALLGLNRDTGIKEVVAAGLMSVCYQTRDLLEAMINDGADLAETLRVDGGMVANDWFAQALADTLNAKVQRPQIIETTALGAAYLAGLHCGIFKSLQDIEALWKCNGEYVGNIDNDRRESLYNGWLEAIDRVKSKK